MNDELERDIKDDTTIFAVVFGTIIALSLLFVTMAATKAKAREQADHQTMQVSTPMGSTEGNK